MKKILILGILIVSMNISAQIEKFSYYEGMCDFEGQFDKRKVTREQLQNTVDYLWKATIISTDAVGWNFEEVKTLSVIDLREECATKLHDLKTLKFVDDPFWNRLNEELQTYYESSCLVMEYTILAYANPDTLMHYPLEDSISIYYRDVLIKGGETLIDAWKKYNNERSVKFGFSQDSQDKFEEQLNSPQREEYARIELMMYGWWNSVNHTLPHIELYDYSDEFGRLLMKVKENCD